MKIEEYNEGGNNGTVLKFPGRVSWSNITLKRGMADEQLAVGLALRLRQGHAASGATA